MRKITILAVSLSFLPFLLMAQLSGTRSVPSVNYPTIQSVVDSLNTYGSSGNGIVFELAGGSVFQCQQLTISATGTETAPVSLVWDGTSTKPVLEFSGTGAANESGMLFQGSDYFTLDGLQITNPDGNLDYGIWITNASATDGANHNVVKNCVIQLNKLNVNQTVGVYVAPVSAVTSFEGNNHFNSFINNHLMNMTMGYSFDGATSTTSLMGVGNEVMADDGGESIVEDLVMAGLLIDDQNGFTLTGTKIRNLVRTGSGTTAPAGISTTSGNPSANLDNPFVFANNEIYYLSSSFTSVFGTYFSARKATYHIAGNLVYGVNASGGGGNTADGIAVIGTDIIAYIYNNMISDIAAPASAVSGNAATRGINVRTYLEAYVYHNSVYLEYDATNLSHHSAAFIIYNNSDPVEMRNNIFVNKTNFPEGATGIGAAFYKRTPALTNVSAASNNNLYYAGTPSANNVIFYGHNSSAPAIDQTLEAYQLRAATFDQVSYTEDVPFLTGIDLHVQPLASTVVRGNATPVTSPVLVNHDFDGQWRDASNPDIGADELANPFPVAGQDPVPASGSVDVPVGLPALQWSYVADPMYVDPVVFKLFLHTSPDFTGVEPIAVVPYISGVQQYETSLSNLTYETTYYWKVIPTIDAVNGPDAQGVETWEFTTALFVFPYPNTAVNPNPDGTSVVSVGLTALEWDFNALVNYTVPAGFKVYLSENEVPGSDDFLIWIPYNNGQTTYAASLSGLSLNYNTTYHWKVVPSVDEISGPDAEGVVVWFFSTELIPFPSLTNNPNPEVGGVIRLGNALAVHFGWEFTPDPNHILPAAFKVYASADTNSAMWATPVGYVNFEPGTLNYSLDLLDSPNFDYTFNVPNYWKVVPTTALPAGIDALNAQTWNFHFDEYVGLDENRMSIMSLKPNPAAEYLELSISGGIQGVVKLVNTNGKELLSIETGMDRVRLDLRNIANGVYYVRFLSGNRHETHKLIIRK